MSDVGFRMKDELLQILITIWDSFRENCPTDIL